MGLFSSFKWFKNQIQQETDALELKAAKLKVAILEKEYAEQEKPKQLPAATKVYKKVKLVDNRLTIILHDGNILTKTQATQEDFFKARDAKFESELFAIAYSEEGLQEKRKIEEERVKTEKLIAGIQTLEDNEDFEIRDGSVYMVGANGSVIERSMPQLLVEKFIELVSDEFGDTVKYQALKKFWMKCCLNPNAQSAEDLYEFLSHHQFKIDRHGNFYAYRRVVSQNNGGNKQLVDFVSNAYNKVKGVWKKKPADYYVWGEDDGTLSFSKESKPDEIAKLFGNLQELYLDLPNMQQKMFTSAHTHTEDYRVGEIISMPRNDGDDNNHISCSKGFHAASKAYDYSGFGDTPILVIINPMDVLAVPRGEVGKLRTCRWFFAMTLPEEEQHILDNDEFDTIELGDVFEEKCATNLTEYVHNSFAEEVKRHTFTLPQISAREINNIIRSLDDMKAEISGRVEQFD